MKITESHYNNLFVKRRMNEIWELVVYSYPYGYPCDYDREDFIDAICGEIGSVVWFDDWDDSVTESVKEFIRTHYKDRILDMWDSECDSPKKINESKMIEDYQASALEKIVNSDLIRKIYPMVTDIKVLVPGNDINLIVLRIHVDDPEMTEENMYKRGLDPHYLTDHHFYNYFSYLDIPKDTKIGHVVIGPTQEIISRWIP